MGHVHVLIAGHVHVLIAGFGQHTHVHDPQLLRSLLRFFAKRKIRKADLKNESPKKLGLKFTIK